MIWVAMTLLWCHCNGLVEARLSGYIPYACKVGPPWAATVVLYNKVVMCFVPRFGMLKPIPSDPILMQWVFSFNCSEYIEYGCPFNTIHRYSNAIKNALYIQQVYIKFHTPWWLGGLSKNINIGSYFVIFEEISKPIAIPWKSHSDLASIVGSVAAATHIYMYIYIYICVCVCNYISKIFVLNESTHLPSLAELSHHQNK